MQTKVQTSAVPDTVPCQAAVDSRKCKMECNKPQCAVICPNECDQSSGCPGKCTTQCGHPECKLRCNDTLTCTEVCENPICEWDCAKPKECAKPDCQMHCDLPQCAGSTYRDMPPLSAHEMVVESFGANLANPAKNASGNASLLHVKSTMQKRTLPVNVEFGELVDGKVR